MKAIVGAAAAVLAVLAVIVGVRIAFHDTPAPQKQSVATTPQPPRSAETEEHAQPQPQKLEKPVYPGDSSCGRSGDVEGLDAQGVLAFQGLCIPLVTKPEGYVHWRSSPDEFMKGERNALSFEQPSGVTTLSVYVTPGTPSLMAVGQAYLPRECAGRPEYFAPTTVAGLPTLHAFVRECGVNQDQRDHFWFVKRPDGRVIVVVAENPDTTPGVTKTLARVEDSMEAARYFG